VQANSDVHIHWKGAAELVLGSCTQFLDTDGSIRSINDEKVIKAVSDLVQKLAFSNLL